MRLRRAMLLCNVLLLVVSMFIPLGSRVLAASSINGHAVITDGSGKIIPWTTNPGDGYGTVVTNAWSYLVNTVPKDPSTGKPAFYSQSYLNPDTQAMAGWPNNPAGMFSMLTESALKYYAYSGDRAPVDLVEGAASWQLAHGMSAATDTWANLPYSSGDAGSTTYQGASYGNSTGVGDGTGYLQPDKAGAMGAAWLQLYQFDGNTAYRDAAIAVADTLASQVRTGNATQSPWPFRVKASDGTIREQYTANVIDPIQLLDGLIAAGLGNTAAYQTARTTAWNWLMTYPMVNNTWSNYFEDVAVQSSLTNYNQLTPMMTARYLLQHPDKDANWESHVRGLITWVENNFAVSDSGAATIKEQNAFMYPMGSHTSRYASVNALLAQATGDQTALTKAYYSLNWATYMGRPNGVTIDGPQVNNQWFTDGYGDYIRHFLTAMQAEPQWAPNGQTHLTGSSSLVTSVSYTAGGVQYTTLEPSATDSLRVNFTPATILVNGTALAQVGVLDQDGWTYDASTGVLRIKHSAGTAVQIVSGTPGNTPPSVSLTTPASGSAFTAGSAITLNATATDTDGTVSKVDFYSNTTLLGTSTTAPYSFTWASVPAGSYNVTAVATDNSGGITTSANASISVTAASTLPTPWTSGDIGSTGVAGSATYASGIFSVKGSGVDVWGNADSFQYVYQPLDGNGTITARVASQQNTDPWALAGVMIRESLTAGSREAIAAVTPSNGVSFTWRSATNGASSYTNGNAGSAPYWLRLQRSGNTITAFKSANGTTWTQYASTTITMGTSVYVGLAVTSHNNNVLATDTFDNVTVTGSADTTPPTISAITTGTINQNGGSVAWTTNEASDSQVEYGLTTSYGQSTSVNSSLVTSHSVVVSGLNASTTYHYRVKSRDAAGNLATSGDNVFNTQAQPDTTAPSQPANLSAPLLSAYEVDLSWSAATDDTAVTGYRIYRNNVQIGTSASLSYNDTTASQQNTYTYSVSAVDAAGNESIRSGDLVVTTPQFVDMIAPSSPGNPSASAQSGPTVRVAWVASTDNVGVAGYRVYRDGTVLTDSTATTYTDNAVAAGETHSYYISAYDTAGNESQPSLAVSVTLPVPDTTAPSIPTNLLAGTTTATSVALSWTASSDNVAVTSYTIFRDGVQIGTSTTPTYTATGLTPATSYSFTVKASDAAGNSSSASTALAVTTAAAPSGVTIDKSVVIKQTTASTSLTAPTFSTTGSNELLVAFIASDGPNATMIITGVTGGGLTWTLAKRVNTQRGTAEIWTATTLLPTASISVKATHTGSYQTMMQVVAFQNAQVGTTGSGNASTGAPTASITTTAANAWVWGIGNDWDSATARSVGTNQVKENEMLATAGDTFWVQRQTNTTATKGTVVTLNATKPTNDRWNLAVIEIIPR